MKRFALILLSASLLAGCARYDMTLTNGVRITNVSKPTLDRSNDVYTYKDVAGNQRFIGAGRVVEIAPHSNRSDDRLNGR